MQSTSGEAHEAVGRSASIEANASTGRETSRQSGHVTASVRCGRRAEVEHREELERVKQPHEKYGEDVWRMSLR